jgi:hypothetical protein
MPEGAAALVACPECGHPDGQHDEAGCLWPQWNNTPGVPTCPCARGSATGPSDRPQADQAALIAQADSIIHAIEHDTGHVLTEWERGLIETTVKYLAEEDS